MDNKDKIIKEMAILINGRTETDTMAYYKSVEKAKKIYDMLLPEDSVVLSKEELENIYEQAEQNVLANIADGGTSCHWCIEQHEKIGYEKGSKETAEKILIKGKQLVEKWLSKDDEKVGFIFDFEEFIKKQFGVEIKE